MVDGTLIQKNSRDRRRMYPNTVLLDVGSDSSMEEGEEEDDYEGCPLVISNGKNKIGRSDIRVIATSTENFISFQKPVTNTLSARFLDSYRFLINSLSKLADLLEDSKMHHTKKYYRADDEFEIASQKGVFPYEYINSLYKYQEKTLPKKEEFFSSVTGRHITENEYKFAEKAFKLLKCKDLGDYNDHYLRIDVLLLANIFENFRETCFEIYKIDLAHCYPAPSLSYNVMLKTIGKPIPLLTDYDMHMFIENGIRGGYCNVSKRHVKANNRYMGNDFDPSKPEKYIFYGDTNNLYGYSMSESLPFGDYKWMNEWELSLFREGSFCIPKNVQGGI